MTEDSLTYLYAAPTRHDTSGGDLRRRTQTPRLRLCKCSCARRRRVPGLSPMINRRPVYRRNDARRSPGEIFGYESAHHNLQLHINHYACPCLSPSDRCKNPVKDFCLEGSRWCLSLSVVVCSLPCSGRWLVGPFRTSNKLFYLTRPQLALLKSLPYNDR
jgi:hypothetical protein